MHPSIEWLKDHWFLLAAGVSLVSVQAVALDDINDLKKENDERKAVEQVKAQQVRQVQQDTAAIDERTKIILEAVQQMQQQMMRGTQ